MSLLSFISLPKELDWEDKPLFSDKYKIFFLTLGEHFWDDDLYFQDGSFKNRFVYQFFMKAPDLYYEERGEIVSRYSDRLKLLKNLSHEEYDNNADVKAMKEELEKYYVLGRRERRKFLKSFINDMIDIGEFVEIYCVCESSRNQENILYATPKTQSTTNLEELIDLLGHPEIKQDHKLTIYKTT